jgi:cytochrome c peroxidase
MPHSFGCRHAAAKFAALVWSAGSLWGSLIWGSLIWASPAAAQSPSIAPTDIVRPAASKPFALNPATKLQVGTLRHSDKSLSPQGRSCNSCHADANSYNPTFNKPWPHAVASVKAKSGLEAITAEGMVQFCMISAMGTRPLPWDSEALAALTAFVLDRHQRVVKP